MSGHIAPASPAQDPQTALLPAGRAQEHPDPGQPPDDLLYGSSELANPAHDVAAGLPPGTAALDPGPPALGVQGGWFADPTPGVDDHGQRVRCRVCRTLLSQPRIDYGLTTCPACRIVVASTTTRTRAATSTLDVPS